MALKGVIPEAVRRRPKAPVAGFPDLVRARHAAKPDPPPIPQMARYLDISKLPEWPGRDRGELEFGLRALGLHYWLAGME